MLHHQGDTTIMQKDYYDKHREIDRDIYQEIDRDIQRQEALARYRRLKFLKKPELSLDDEIFIENFETAMGILWGFQKVEITTFSDAISIPTECNKAS
jgi:hypothetical protein